MLNSTFCGSKLLIYDAVYNTHPDFTFCVQYSFILWSPCLLFWLIFPFWVFKVTKRQPNKIKLLSWLIILKTIVTLGLVAIEIAHLVKAALNHRHAIYFTTPSLLIFTYCLVLGVTFYSRKNGYRYSVPIFIYWLCMLLSSSINLRSKILYQIFGRDEKFLQELKAQYDGDDYESRLMLTHWDIYSFYAFYALVLVSLILSLFSERIEFKTKAQETTASMLSYLLFWWTNPLIRTGYKKTLTKENLFEIDDREKVHTNVSKLEALWTPLAEKYICDMRALDGLGHCDQHLSDEEKEKVKLNGSGNHDSSAVSAKERKKKEPSLGLCLVRIYGFKFTGVLAMVLCNVVLVHAKPIILDKLIGFVKDKEQTITVGVFYVGLLVLTSLTSSLIAQHFFHTVIMMGNRMKSSFMQLIFKKSIRLSTTARKSTTVGQMTNLLSVNADTFDFALLHFIAIIGLPFRIGITVYMLCQYIGVVATLVGMITMFVFVPLNVFFLKKSRTIRSEKYIFQDSRIKVMSEILNGIRVIKFYGWEKSFEMIIQKTRRKELMNLVKTYVLTAMSMFVVACTPITIACISFATYILISGKNDLDPKTAFVSITLFNMLRFPLMILPMSIQGLIQLNVSFTRIREFLLKDEYVKNDITHENTPNEAIQVDRVSFGWNRSDVALSEIEMRVPKGQLVAVIGKVGSGKSSLIYSLLGEMHKINKGRVNVNGSVSFVPQQAWIKNETVKNNILFNAPHGYEPGLYQKVLKACQLLPDMDIMAAGDETEIGEKGINLSGGQKQRISLARAVYSNTDIYLLDDPLSAVDAHVGKSLFDQVLGPTGLLKNKTRILVTNSLNYLSKADHIIMLENGRIVESGTYSELSKKQGSIFMDYVKNYAESPNSPESPGVKNESFQYQKQMSRQESVKANEQPGAGETDKLMTESEKDKAKIIETEKIQTGNVQLSVVFEYFKACRLPLSFLFFFLFALSYCAEIGSNFWLSSWSNREAENRSVGLSSKLTNLAVYASLGYSKAVISLLAGGCFVGMIVTSSKRLHNKLLVSILKSSLRFFESTPTGRILNRFTKDVEATEEAIPNSLQSLLECLFGILSALIIICTTTPLIIIILVPIAVVYIFVQRYFIPSNRQLKRMFAASKSPVFSHFSETQVGVSTIRAFGGEEWAINAMEEKVNANILLYYCNIVSNRWLALRLELIGNLITILAAAFAIISRSSLSAGLAGLSISISLNISEALNMFVRFLSEFEANITSVERIKEYFEIKHEGEWTIEETKPAKSWPENGKINFENYSLKYREDLNNVLSDLNININPGEKIGIVGRTGAGKSSLTLALFRLLEHTKGDIVIDNININKIGLHDLRHKLTIIPQDPVIFSGTIRMNLDPFKMHTDEEVWRSLELSHLKEFVSSQDKKLEFECSEGGENLSVGQRQLICLARALLRKTKILILDEATASIDYNTDELIQETIRSQFSECTVLTIAHRLNTIMDSSRILVLDKGKVAEFDTPQSLLAQKNGIFYSMAKNAGLV